MLVKLFGNTPLKVRELERVTIEAARDGAVVDSEGVRISLPKSLCKEILDYAEMEGITAGIVFRTRNGVPIDRSNVNRKISELGDVAKVASEKVNPRSLRKLHLKMMQELQMEYEPLIARSYERQLEAEQRLISWADGLGAS